MKLHLFRISVLFLLLVSVLTLVPSAAGQADKFGQWSTLPYTMPINPVHVILLYNGKILVVTGSGNCPPSQSGCPSGPPYSGANGVGAVMLDLGASSFANLTVSWDMFCNSMSQMADGRVFINGGNLAYDPFRGSKKSSIFDPATNLFSDVQDMAHGRWYPTTTLLSDGRIMTYSGSNDLTGATNTAVEIYTPGFGWSPEYASGWTPPLYPRLHLLPNGNVFYSGPSNASFMFNPTSHAWTLMAGKNYPKTRTYGSSVLLPLTPANSYRPKVMVLGGNADSTGATATTEIIDLGASSPAWVYGPDMSQPRVEMDAVLLPNGKVLAMGGSTMDEQASSASLNADLYDGSTFTSAGANAYPRLYHTVALLLPDATVWLAGGNPTRGNYEQRMEIYRPSYLYTRDANNSVVAATRPTISSVPGSIYWASPFTVATPNAASISSISLMRLGSSTHAFDMDQRMVGLSFTAGSGSLTVTGPPNANIAPPGYYMLFILNSQGVPSVAKILRLGATSNPAPAVTSIQPTTGPAAGGTPVNIAGTGFLSGAAVSFGGTPATDVTVVNSTSITATTPAHTAGTVNVVVTNTDAQTGTLSGGYTFNAGSGGGGPITFIQVNAATPSNPVTSVSVPYPVSQTAGDFNIVVVGWNNTTSTVSSLTDTRGNAYSLAVGPTSGTGLRQSIYYAKNIGGGSNTVNVTMNASTPYVDVRVLEYSGLDLSNPLDVTAAAAGSGTAANSGASSTNSASELIFGAGTTSGSFNAPGSGFTLRIITDPDADIAEDKASTAAGSFNATATLHYSTNWVMQMASFRAAGQGSTNPAPTVTSISPLSGPPAGGTSVTIRGTGFLSGATVKLGGTSATGVTVSNSTTITATAPAHAAGVVDVVVTNSDSQSATLTGGYSYANPAPTITSISPTSGPTSGGTTVTINGTGFLSGASVTFGTTAATGITVVNGTKITATAPAHAAGAVQVTVTNTDGQSVSTLPESGYTYASGTPPTVSSASPNSGSTAGGLSVTITGTGFSSGATVKLGGTSATGVTVNGSTSITATTPAHAAGAVDVVVTNTDQLSGTLTGGFTYTTGSGGGGPITFIQVNAATPPNSVTSVSVAYPLSQAAGNFNIVVVGWNNTTSTVTSLTDTRGNTYSLAAGPVTGNGLRQSVYYAKNIASGSNTVNVTMSASTPYVDVRVLEYSGIDSSSPLDVFAGAAGTGTSASSGSVTTNFANELIFGAGTTAGSFNAAGTGYTLRIITNPDSDIAEDRAATALGSFGTTATLNYSTFWVMQVVTFKAAGQGTSNPAPTVSTVSPNSGSTAGGLPVTITGTGFASGATVTFGGTAATGVTVHSSTSITANTPAHAAGAVNVVVTNTDLQSGTATNGFTYTTGSGGGGPITFIQVNAATPPNPVASVPVNYPLAQTAGNLNIVVVGWNNTTSTVSSVTDTRGNTYTLAAGPVTGSGLRQSIYYAKNIVAGSNTVTVTMSTSTPYVDVRVLEYSGLDTSSPLDVTAGASGTGTSASSGPVTTNFANELIFGAGTTAGSFNAAGTGYTLRIITNPDADIAEDRAAPAVGSFTATAPLNYDTNWIMQVATFH